MIEFAIEAGVSIESVLKLDMKQYQRVCRGYLRRQEMIYNQLLTIGHRVVNKLTQAFSSEDSHKFREPMELVHFLKDDELDNIVDMVNKFEMSPEAVEMEILRGGDN